MWVIIFWHVIACLYWSMASAIYGGTEHCNSTVRAKRLAKYGLQNSPLPSQTWCFVDDCRWYGDCPRLSDNGTVLSASSGDPPDSWIPHPDLADHTVPAQYVQSFFWSLEVTVGIGDDIIPGTDPEVAFTTLMTIIGLLMYSAIIGSASSLVQTLDSEKATQDEKIDRINIYFRAKHVPDSFQRAIVAYYHHKFDTPSHESGVLSELPESLRVRLALVLNRDLFVRIPVFSFFSAQSFMQIMRHLTPLTFLPGEFIVQAGDLITNVYFIKLGTVDLISPRDETVRGMSGAALPTIVCVKGAMRLSIHIREVATTFTYCINTTCSPLHTTYL